MNKEELKAALDELRVARNYIDRAISAISDLMCQPTSQELSLQLAELEGWVEMEKYMSGRKAQ
jgi:hypothetical protein